METLLLSARSFNQHSGITGVLLYSGGHFMQCFEGADEEVQKTYDRIRLSRAHTGLVEYMDGPVPERAFEGWAMGCAMPSDSELLSLSGAQWRATSASTFSPAAPPGLQLLKVFWSMRQAEL